VMSAKAQWATLNVPQLKCWECKDRLDKYLLRETGSNGDNGILKWTVNMGSGTLKIQYVPDRITLDYIRTAINNAGFDVDSTMATPDAYKLLPPICKRAAEGGGQVKGQPSCKLPPEERQ
jgi:mercuric ion binding protein